MAEQSFGPVVVRRRLGAELRRLRERAGLNLDQVAREMEVSPSKLSRVEGGHSPAKLWDVRNLLTLYGVEDEDYRERVERWVGESRAQGWWVPYSDASPLNLDHYISLEAEAREIRSYSTPILYGLLQTEGYARAVLRNAVPTAGEAVLEGLVQIKLRRQEVLRRADGPVRLRAVVDEAVVHRATGGTAVMRAQLEHLASLASTLDLRVRPLSAPFHPATMAPFTVFVPRESDVDPIVANVESGYHDVYWEEAAEVESYDAAFDSLQRSSLDAEQSLEFFTRLAEGMTSSGR